MYSWVTPVSVLITATDAPGMAACAASVTVPLIEPAPEVCALAETAEYVRKSAARASTAKHLWGQLFRCIFMSWLSRNWELVQKEWLIVACDWADKKNLIAS